MSVVFWNGEYLAGDQCNVIKSGASIKSNIKKVFRSKNSKFAYGVVGDTPSLRSLHRLDSDLNALLFKYIDSGYCSSKLVLSEEMESSISYIVVVACNDFCLVIRKVRGTMTVLGYDKRVPVAVGSGDICAQIGMAAGISPEDNIMFMNMNSNIISEESTVIYMNDLIPYITRVA